MTGIIKKIKNFAIATYHLFIAAGKGLPGYRLVKESPAIKAGVVVENGAAKDFFGKGAYLNKLLFFMATKLQLS